MSQFSWMMVLLLVIFGCSSCSSQLDYGLVDKKKEDESGGSEEGVLLDPSRGDTYLGINAGGPEFVTSDGFLYRADMNFDGGDSFSTDKEISGTIEDILYQSERVGDVAYRLPVANGSYWLNIHLAEFYWVQAGKRQFDMFIEGDKILNDFDILNVVEPNEALTYKFFIEIKDGFLDLQFNTEIDRAKISAFILGVLGSDRPEMAN